MTTLRLCRSKLHSALLLGIFVLVSSALSEETTTPGISDAVLSFVENYCLDCHDDQSTKGDRDFLPFLDNPTGVDQLLSLEEILDQLNLGEMPPQKKGVDQPSDKERIAVVDEITEYLLAHEANQYAKDTVLRRLTRYEYNNTIRDLLGVKPDLFDFTSAFPEDEKFHGFATVGESQVLSNHQLGLYIDAARKYLDQVLVFGQEKPEKRIWEIAPSEFSKNTEGGTAISYRALDVEGKYVDIGHGEPADRRPNIPSSFSRKGVPASGIYRIRVTAEGVGRLDHGYDPKVLGINTSQRIKLGVWFGTNKGATEKTTTRGRNLIGVYSLQDYKPDTFEVTTWMPKGAVPFFNWINGPGASKGPTRRVVEKYHPEADRLTPTDVDSMREDGNPITDEEVTAHNSKIVTVASVYRGPRLRIHDVYVEGPIETQWPPPNHVALVGSTTDPKEVDIPKVIKEFAQKAFRRPVSEEEIAHNIGFVYHSIAQGDSHAEAIKAGFAAILSSPHFLFLNEGNAEDSELLSPNQIANRLSYFLWGSKPDEELLKAAANGTAITREKPLRDQFDRMLPDPRTGAFVKHFVDGWLRLDKLGTMPPGPKQFPTYLKRRLEDGMRTETEMLFSHILMENRPITDFINADYTFLNDNMAEHYGVFGCCW